VKYQLKTTTLAVCAVALSGPALAATEAGVPLGSGWTLTPSVGVTALYDSNLYRQDIDETTATGSLITPGLGLNYLTSKNTFSLAYAGQFGAYNTSSADDYGHNDVSLTAKLNQGGRNRFDLGVSRDENHDPFGTERTETIPSTQRDVDEFALTSAYAAYTFGAPSATLNVTLRGDIDDKSYSNNRFATQYLDRSKAGGGLEVRVRLSPKTGLLLDTQYHEVSFDETDPASTKGTRDGTELRARVGIQWFATSTFVGRARIGWFQRDNDSSAREDLSTVDWELSMTYMPTTYSRFVVEGSHSTQESYFDQADFIDVMRFGGQWIHNWSTPFQTGVGAYYNQYSFEGYTRDDDVFNGSLYAKYAFTRWATLRLSINADNRQSNLDSLDFDRYVSALTLEFAL
jgi:hypothetical protein